MYYLVDKIECIDGNMQRSTIGYLANVKDVTSLTDAFPITYQSWVDSNLTALQNGEDYCTLQKIVLYDMSTQTTDISGFDLKRIQDPKNPEG